MIFLDNIKVNRCNDNCNNISNPYSNICVPGIIKNVALKVFYLMTLTNKTKQIIFYENCKCVCRLDSIVCNNKQKWNKNKCRCQCSINKKCGNIFWNPNSCKCEFRKKPALITIECKEIIDSKAVSINKTISTITLDSCKPFVASSFLFLSVSVILTGLFIYFYPKSKSKNYLPY